MVVYVFALFFGFIEKAWLRPQLCNADKHANGCSVPLGINAPYKSDFTPACNKHDICYGCVSLSLLVVSIMCIKIHLKKPSSPKRMMIFKLNSFHLNNSIENFKKYDDFK